MKVKIADITRAYGISYFTLKALLTEGGLDIKQMNPDMLDYLKETYGTGRFKSKKEICAELKISYFYLKSVMVGLGIYNKRQLVGEKQYLQIAKTVKRFKL